MHFTKVDTFDLLGIVPNETMSWNSHLFKIQVKISKVLGIMNCLKHYLPQQTLQVIYNSLILPHFLYGILLWGLRSNKLSKLQNRAVRIITMNKRNAHVDPLFKRLKMLKLEDLFLQQQWKFYYKFKKGVLPPYFKQFSFPRQGEVHPHLTRNRNMLVTPRLKYEFSKSAIKYRLPKFINDATENDDTKDILDKITSHSLHGFNFYIKTIFINAYAQ